MRCMGSDFFSLDPCLRLMVNINDDPDIAFHKAEIFVRSDDGVGAVSRQCAEL